MIFFHGTKTAICIMLYIIFCRLNKYSNLHDTQEIMQRCKLLYNYYYYINLASRQNILYLKMTILKSFGTILEYSEILDMNISFYCYKKRPIKIIS